MTTEKTLQTQRQRLLSMFAEEGAGIIGPAYINTDTAYIYYVTINPQGNAANVIREKPSPVAGKSGEERIVAARSGSIAARESLRNFTFKHIGVPDPAWEMVIDKNRKPVKLAAA